MRWGGAAAQHGHAFISYVREDKRRVDRLQEFLEANGVPVWRDTGSLWPGEDWRAKIRDAIAADSLAFVACFSKNSENKEKSYQRDELLLAIEQLRLLPRDRPYLLPVRFDDCPIPDWEIGPGRTLNSLQWVDLFGKQWQTNAQRLVEGVEHILRPPPAAGRGRRRAAKPISHIAVAESGADHPGFIRRLSWPRRFAAAFASLAIIAAAAAAGIQFFGSGSPSGLPPPPPGMRVTDQTGAISVVVPKSWGNMFTDGWHPQEYIPDIVHGSRIGPGINASPNVGNWFKDLTTPGIFVGASKLLVAKHYNPVTALSEFAPSCDFASKQPAATHGLTGYQEMWTCPGSSTRYETVALWPANHSYIAFIELKIVTPVDESSGKRALDSLSVRY
jgi:TIR domain